MSTAMEAAARIRSLLPAIRSGSLCFYGEWFGGRPDAWYRVTDAEAQGDSLIVRFDEGETLTIDQPDGVTITDQVFRIDRASRVRWQWFYYGRPQQPENLYEMQYTHEGDRVSVDDSADWYEPEHHPDPTAPAVEMG